MTDRNLCKSLFQQRLQDHTHILLRTHFGIQLQSKKRCTYFIMTNRTEDTISPLANSGSSDKVPLPIASEAPTNRNNTTPPAKPKFACSFPGCHREFNRKTCLTNHFKAHANKNSRVSKKMKRDRDRAAKMAPQGSRVGERTKRNGSTRPVLAEIENGQAPKRQRQATFDTQSVSPLTNISESKEERLAAVPIPIQPIVIRPAHYPVHTVHTPPNDALYAGKPSSFNTAHAIAATSSFPVPGEKLNAIQQPCNVVTLAKEPQSSGESGGLVESKNSDQPWQPAESSKIESENEGNPQTVDFVEDYDQAFWDRFLFG